MKLYRTYSKDEIAKIGNTLIFLAEKIPEFCKFKALHLIYIIEELSIVKTGSPFLNLNFYIWKNGPIAADLYVELSDNLMLLAQYVALRRVQGKTFVAATEEFNDGEFSDNEVKMLELIVETFRELNSDKLTEYVRREQTLWYRTAERYGILNYFDLNQLNNTEIELDLRELISGDNFKTKTYLQHQTYLKRMR